MTTPIVISIDGMLNLENFEVETFIREITYMNGVERFEFGKTYSPPNQRLEPGDKRTVPFDYFNVNPLSPVVHADVALVMNFTMPFIPWHKKTKIVRFVTATQADGMARFEIQPAGDTLDLYKKTKNFDFPRPTQH
jgi:hypothetical protein